MGRHGTRWASRRWAVVATVVVSTVLGGLAQGAVANASTGRVAVIVMENEKYTNIYQKAQAPYINSLISQGDFLNNYAAIIGGSLHDYLAMTSGLTSKLSPPSPNIFAALDGHTEGWTSLQESMPANCGGGTSGKVPGTTTPLYSTGHDPAYQYRNNASCSKNDIPMTSSSFNPSSLPPFTFIVPNQCDDMHTLPANGQACPGFFGPVTGKTKITMGDNWLRQVVPQLLSQPDMTVIITWDEGSSTTAQHIVTLMVGAGVTPGSTDTTSYNHYGLLAGLYATLGLGTAPNNAATATPVPIP